MTLAKRFITDHEIHLMAQAALDSYEMSADKNAAMQAAREYATDELHVLPRRSAVLLAYKLAMQGWDQIKFNTKEYIAYTIFADAEMTSIRQFAEATGTKAEKIRTAFKNIKGGSLKTGDVICGCRIDRLDSEETPVY